jgi:hypothetical protein
MKIKKGGVMNNKLMKDAATGRKRFRLATYQLTALPAGRETAKLVNRLYEAGDRIEGASLEGSALNCHQWQVFGSNTDEIVTKVRRRVEDHLRKGTTAELFAVARLLGVKTE